jgi:hypothetical protein
MWNYIFLNKRLYLLFSLFNLSFSLELEKQYEVPYGVYTNSNILEIQNISRRNRVLSQIEEINQLSALLVTWHLYANESLKIQNTKREEINALFKKLNVKKVLFFSRSNSSNVANGNSEQYRIIFTIGEKQNTHIIAFQTFLYKDIRHIQESMLYFAPQVIVNNNFEKISFSSLFNLNSSGNVAMLKMFEAAMSIGGMILLYSLQNDSESLKDSFKKKWKYIDSILILKKKR